jgi:hypothetical protein
VYLLFLYPSVAWSRCEFRLYMILQLTLNIEFWFCDSDQLGLSLCRTKCRASCSHRTGPHCLCNQTVHNNVQGSPLLIPGLSRIKPIHNLTYYIQHINFNIIPPSTFNLPNHFLPPRLLTNIFNEIFIRPLRVAASHSPLYIRFNIWGRVETE